MTREAGSQPTVGVPSFGEHGYCKEEQSHLQGQLAKKLGPNLISQRASTTEGQRIAFVETWKLIALANELFGFNGWSNSITSQSIDFVDESDGLYYAGVNACVRVTLRDGTYHEELGYGMAEGLPSKGGSLEKARKEAVADGLKRCLRNFGNALGNCLGDKHYLQWVVNQSDAHLSSPANSSSDSLVSELITASQMTPPTNENSTATVTTTVLDMQQQQFLQLQLQHQNSMTCLQPAARLGQATFPPQRQQQIPLLAPFALAAATGGGGAAAGLTTSAQQLFLVRPVASQTSGLATAAGLLPGNSFTTRLQQRPPSHQVQRLHGIFNNVTQMSSTACSGVSAAQGSLPITIQSGNSSSSGVHTVMTNNFIQPLMANHVQGGMLNLHTALSNSQTNFLNNLQNGLACGVQNNLPNSSQSSITNLVVQNCITKRSPKSVPSSVSASNVVNNPPSSLCKNTFAKPGPLSKSTKSTVKAVAQHPARDIAPRSSAASHSSRTKDSVADVEDVTCTTQSRTSRLRVVMPPLEKPVQAATTSTNKSTRGDRSKGRKRSRAQSSLRETFSSCMEPRQKKASIPLVTIHSQLDPKNDIIDVKQETLDEDESPYSHDIEQPKNSKVGMNSYPLRSREASPKEKKGDAVSPHQITKEVMLEEPSSGATTAFEELDRSVVADAMSKLFKEGTNELEMDFDRHSEKLRKEVEIKSLGRIQTKPIVASPLLGGSSVRKGVEKKLLSKTRNEVTAAIPMLVDSSLRKDVDKSLLCKTQDKTSVASPTLVDSSFLKEVRKDMLCKTQDKVSATNILVVDSSLQKDMEKLISKTPDKTMVASPAFVDSGRSPRKMTVHIPVLARHQDNMTLDDKVTLDDDKLIDLPDNTSHTAESINSISFIQTAYCEGTVNTPDREYLDTKDIHVSKKSSSRIIRRIPIPGEEHDTKLIAKLNKLYTLETEKECTNTSHSNTLKKKSTSKDFKNMDTEEEESCKMPTNMLVSSNESDNTDGESKTKKSLRHNNLATEVGKACRTLMTKEYLALECSNIFQGNGQKVESTSESKNKVSSILKRVNYEKTKSPHLGADASIQFDNRLRDETSRLRKSDPGGHCKTKPVLRECIKTSIKTSESDLGDVVKDSDAVTLNDNGYPTPDENSNNSPREKTNHIVTNEEGKCPDGKTDNMNTSNILPDVSEPTIEDAEPAMNEKPVSLTMEYKDLFNQSNSPFSEDENTFTGFTADMCMKTSPQTLIDLEMHIKQQKPIGDESEEKEKQRNAMKLDRQRHFRHNLRIKFKGSSGGRALIKKTATAAGRRTSGASSPKLANGHRSEEATPASHNRDLMEGPNVGDGLDQFATSLGLTPRRLLSGSPVTPLSAFLPEKRPCTTSKQQQGEATSHSLLPSSNILMKALQQPTLSPSPPGDASYSTSSTAPLSDVSADSSSEPSKGVNNRFAENAEALTSVGDIQRAATMPTPEEMVCEATTMPTLDGRVSKAATMPTADERKVSVSKSALASSSSPSLLDDDVSSKPNSPVITTTIPTDGRNASFSRGDLDNSSSNPSNFISLYHTSAVGESAQRAQNGSVKFKPKVLDDTSSHCSVSTNEGVTKNNKSCSSRGICASPCSSAVSSKLSELSTIDCISPGRLASNDLCDEASVGSKFSGKMGVGCLDMTHLASSVDSGVVGSEQEVNKPSGSGDKQKTIEEVPKTNKHDSVAVRNGKT